LLKQASSGRLTKAEGRAVGQVDRAVYAAYFRQAAAALRLALLGT
jgi:hypothetical protein